MSPCCLGTPTNRILTLQTNSSYYQSLQRCQSFKCYPTLIFNHQHCYLWKGQGPESKDAKKEDVEGPEEDDEGVEVVLEAGEDERLDCLPYVQGRGNCTVIMFLLIVVCVAVHRVGPQTQKLPNLEITLDPTWSVHKIARGERLF